MIWNQVKENSSLYTDLYLPEAKTNQLLLNWTDNYQDHTEPSFIFICSIPSFISYPTEIVDLEKSRGNPFTLLYIG